MDAVEEFIKEYEALCRKYNLCVDVTEVWELGIFDLNKEENLEYFERQVQIWKDQNKENH